MLAARLGEREGVRVLEAAVDVTETKTSGLRELVTGARALSGADVTIVPYSPNRLWASGPTHLLQLVITLLLLPHSVVVVHDVYPSRRWWSRNWWALTACGLLGRAVVFHEEHELKTLERVPSRASLVRIPLSVEAIGLPPRSDARARFGLDTSGVVLGMLGWIHPRKNCERAIRTLARVSGNAQLWLIGSATPGAEDYCQGLRQLALELGVADRVSITGYVDDENLHSRLAALDVALVPYAAISASASLSTLIGAQRPVVASELAVTRELHELAPAAVHLADDPVRIAQLVDSIVANPPLDVAFTPILRARSPEAVAERFERVCRDVAR